MIAEPMVTALNALNCPTCANLKSSWLHQQFSHAWQDAGRPLKDGKLLIDGVDSLQTFQRLITGDSILNSRRMGSMIDFIAASQGLPTGLIRKSELAELQSAGSDANYRILELQSACRVPLTAASFKALGRGIETELKRSAESQSSRTFLGSCLPFEFLPAPTLRAVASNWARRVSPKCPQIEDYIIDVGLRARRAFELASQMNPSAQTIAFYPEQAISDLVNGTGPFMGVSKMNRASAIESIAYEAILNRNVLVGHLNMKRVPEGASSFLSKIEGLWIYPHGVMLQQSALKSDWMFTDGETIPEKAFFVKLVAKKVAAYRQYVDHSMTVQTCFELIIRQLPMLR